LRVVVVVDDAASVDGPAICDFFFMVVVVVDDATGVDGPAIGDFFFMVVVVVVLVLDFFGLGVVAAVASIATPLMARPAVTAMARDVRRTATRKPPVDGTVRVFD
jgi:hypothetical protein